MNFRIRHRTLGGYVTVRVFAGPGPATMGKAGELRFTQKEWDTFRTGLEASKLNIQILDEDTVLPDGQ